MSSHPKAFVEPELFIGASQWWQPEPSEAPWEHGALADSNDVSDDVWL